MKGYYNLHKYWFNILVIFFLSGWIPLLVYPQQSDSGNSSKRKKYGAAGSDFSLTSHHGSKMHLHDYAGKIVLITFGYTHCPDVCPLTLSRLKQLMDKLGKQSDQVQTLFISFDPERDTPEHLKTYMEHFHPTFLGLTGTPEEIANVARQYRAVYLKQELKSAAGYLFAHSNYIYLMDKNGQLGELYREETPVDKMAKDIQKLIASQ